MERGGLLRRVRSNTDRRRVDVEITEKGRKQWQRTMRLRGQVTGVVAENGDSIATVAVRGSNSIGDHVTGTVVVAVPSAS